MGKSAIISIIIGVVIIGGILAYFTTTDFSEEPPKTTIKIAINEWPGYAHAFIAQEKGFFEKNGVDVELIFDRDYTASQQRYIDGEVDGVFEVLPDTMFRNTKGLPSKVVYLMDYSESGDVIVGSVNSIEEMKGQTMGVEGINTFSHIFALRTIESHGLTEGDVFFEIVLAQDVVKRLDDGTIQAGHTWEPTRSEAIEKGYNVLANAGDFPYLVTDVLVFNVNIIQERPDDIQKIVQSMFEAQEFQKANPDIAIRIMAEAENVSYDSMLAGVESVFMTDLDENIKVMDPSNDPTLKNAIAEIAEFYLNRGQISYAPTFNDIVEPKFVRELSQ
ncbi:MAG: ABC transporter substrate-binding protein [Thaumarchaeota archaeon]|nr:ABC transporter substrate-binding protein [Nitrososphaerota archaeon]